MPIDRQSGWYKGITHCPSSHYNARPDGEVSLLVIHNISLPPGQFGTGKVQQFFAGKLDSREHPYFAEIADLRVSAHFLIERDGHITQFVSCLERAWHAGLSSFNGRENCNDFSIGIELEGTDDTPFSERQYLALAQLSLELQAAWPAISDKRICGHSEIAPGRKSDPGPCFDWTQFHALRRQLNKGNRT